MTPEEENRKCCVPCGVKHLTEKQKKLSYPVTANRGKCCVCGKVTDVISIRHYNNLEPLDKNNSA